MKFQNTYKNAEGEQIWCKSIVPALLPVIISAAIKRDIKRYVSKKCYRDIIIYLTENEDAALKLITGEYHFGENDDYEDDDGKIANTVTIYLFNQDECDKPVEYFIDQKDVVWEM